MSFGLCNAPSTFQRVISEFFFELLGRGVLVYMDDLLLYYKSIEKHQLLLNKVFTLLEKKKLYVKSEKCALFLETVKFLGHTISSEGLLTDLFYQFCAQNQQRVQGTMAPRKHLEKYFQVLPAWILTLQQDAREYHPHPVSQTTHNV